MRSFILYLCGLILSAIPAVYAENLPANPWLRATIEEVPLQNNDDSNAARTARLTAAINEQLDNPQSQLMQVINEALPEPSRQSSASLQKNLPSWQELMTQLHGNSSTSSASGGVRKAASVQKTVRDTSAGYNEINRAMADIERKYNHAKRTTNNYYHKAKSNIKHLESEAENSMNQLKKVWTR